MVEFYYRSANAINVNSYSYLRSEANPVAKRRCWPNASEVNHLIIYFNGFAVR